MKREPTTFQTVTIDPGNLAETGLQVAEAWKTALAVTLRARSSFDDVRRVYTDLLARIGTPHYLGEDARAGDRKGQRTGGLWVEIRYDPSVPNAYRHSSNAQPLHTDGSYIPAFPNATLMCCVANAAQGGETIFITAEDLVAALHDEQPTLLAQLETVAVPHARSGDRRVQCVIRREANETRLNWNYYCVATEASGPIKDLRDRFVEFLRDSPAVRRAIVPVKLGPGDAVVWKDERLLHGRNAFIANRVGERFLWKCAVDVGVFG